MTKGIKSFINSCSFSRETALSLGLISTVGLYYQYKKYNEIQNGQENQNIREMYRSDHFAALGFLATMSFTIGHRSFFTPVGTMTILGLANVIHGALNTLHAITDSMLNAFQTAYNNLIEQRNHTNNPNPITIRHSEPESRCPICLTNWTSEEENGTRRPAPPIRTILHCGHMACTNCILTMMRNNLTQNQLQLCHTCRTPITGAITYMQEERQRQAAALTMAAQQQPQ